MKVLSLFDGMACGMIAMQLAGVDVESYDAYEIDKYAVKTAKHNFPMIQEHGDVFTADFTQYEGVDFLVGGSPCTYWSIAQTKNRETVASGMGWELFSQYVRALREAKPKYFIYENNKSMSKQIRASIDEAFGFEAVLINSALVSAQNRQRLYWVGKRNADGTYSKVNVEQPEDRGILLKDVLDSATSWLDKSHTIDANYYKATAGTDPFGGHQSNDRMMAAEPIKELSEKEMDYMVRDHQDRRWNFCNKPAEDDKSKCVTANVHKGVPYNVVAEPINITVDGKAQCLRATCYKDTIRNLVGNDVDRRTAVAEPINVTADGKSIALKAQYYKNNISNFVCHADAYGYKSTGVAVPVVEYLKDNQIEYMCRTVKDGRNHWDFGHHFDGNQDKAHCITANIAKVTPYNVLCEPITDICQVGAMPMPNGELSTSAGFRVYSTEAKGRYLCANGGGAGAKTGLYAVPAMPVAEATTSGYTEIECGECVDLSMPNSKTRRGRNMADKSNCMQTSNEFYQYVGYVIEFDENGKPIKAIGKDGKQITIYEVSNGQITIKGKQYPIKLRDGYYIIRKLTVSECKRLQTVPEWYEFPVSNSQAYKMLGNGWTCEVIKHLIDSCLNEKETEFEEQCRWF